MDTRGESDWLAAETARLLGFTAGSRDPRGGFGRQDDRGALVPASPTELWITGRMTHVHALGVLLGHPGSAELVEHGLAALRGRLRDTRYGGWYASVGPDGPVDPGKSCYQHCFVVLGAASATVAGHDGATLLAGALELIEHRFWDESAGMVLESWDSSFGQLEPYRGVNATMHAVEAFLAAFDATGEVGWRDRALRMTERVIDGFARAGVRGGTWRIPEHFDPDWNPLPDHNADQPADPFRPYGATVGHAMEWSRLCVQLAAAIGTGAPGWLVEHPRALFDTAVRDGWAVDGADGFVYTVDWDGTPVVHERMHWVLAEAIAAAAALHAVTGDESYLRWYRTWWDYAERYLIDRAHGSWRHELDRHNRPSATVWSGKPDAYHAVQATLLPRVPLRASLAVALRDAVRAGVVEPLRVSARPGWSGGRR